MRHSMDHVQERQTSQHSHRKKHHDHKIEKCVCAVAKKIHKAQEEVTENECRVSCERSIQQLLSPAKVNSNANTIPFSLDCCGKYFFGKAPVYDAYGNFCIIASPFFKVKKVNHNCCAVLELLWPTCDGRAYKGRLCKDFLHCFDFNGFIGTGACINIDLNKFSSISCHKPAMVESASFNQLQDICKCHKK